jgi:integrase/recombinase XerD
MTDLRRRYMDDMTLYGLAPTTQKVYVHAVKQLAEHYGRSPAMLSEQELRDYFLYLAEKKRVASSTLRIQIFAIKFLFTKGTIKRDRSHIGDLGRNNSVAGRVHACFSCQN